MTNSMQRLPITVECSGAITKSGGKCYATRKVVITCGMNKQAIIAHGNNPKDVAFKLSMKLMDVRDGMYLVGYYSSDMAELNAIILRGLKA